MKKSLFIFLFCGCLFSPKASAQSSFYDSTFADNGSALISLNINENYCDLEHIGLQSDGKIIAVGSTAVNGGSRAVAVRLNSDGSLDASFGNGGEWVSSDIYFLLAREILIQPDDKIVITGWGSGMAKAVRLNADGTYDNTFGNGGQSNFNIWAGGITILIDMELQPDGKILLAGYKAPESAIVRLNVNGTLDTSFGASGKVIIKPSLFGGGANNVYGLKIGLSADNSILAAGIYQHPTKPSPGFVARYTSNGQLDASFGENGIAEFYRLKQQVADLFVSPNDDILVLCDIYDSITLDPKVTLAKWFSNGQIDSSFANQGFAQLSIGGSEGAICRNGFLQPDGKVAVFGISEFTGTKSSMSRFNSDGSMDTSLGIGGVILELGFKYFYNGLVQPDGKIVSVSSYRPSNDKEYGNVRRYLGSNFVGAIETASAISSAFLYPNPMTEQSLTIAYELPAASKIRIDLINMNGEVLGTLLNATRTSGKNEESFKLPGHLENGTYFVNIQSESGNALAKFLIIGR